MLVFKKISHLLGRLESGVWVSASFQIFALTDGRNVPGGGELSRRGNVPGKCPKTLGLTTVTT